MAIDTSIFGQIAQPQLVDPLQQQMQMIQLKNAQLQQQNLMAGIQQRQEDISDDKFLDEHLSDIKQDPNTKLYDVSGLQSVFGGGKRWMKAVTAFNQLNEGIGKFNQAKKSLIEDALEQVKGFEDDPQAMSQMFVAKMAMLNKSGVVSDKALQQAMMAVTVPGQSDPNNPQASQTATFDPALIGKYVDAAMGPDRLKKWYEAKEAKKKAEAGPTYGTDIKMMTVDGGPPIPIRTGSDGFLYNSQTGKRIDPNAQLQEVATKVSYGKPDRYKVNGVAQTLREGSDGRMYDMQGKVVDPTATIELMPKEMTEYQQFLAALKDKGINVGDVQTRTSAFLDKPYIDLSAFPKNQAVQLQSEAKKNGIWTVDKQGAAALEGIENAFNQLNALKESSSELGAAEGWKRIAQGVKNTADYWTQNEHGRRLNVIQKDALQAIATLKSLSPTMRVYRREFSVAENAMPSIWDGKQMFEQKINDVLKDLENVENSIFNVKKATPQPPPPNASTSGQFGAGRSGGSGGTDRDAQLRALGVPVGRVGGM